jgi:hypothetical protein
LLKVLGVPTPLRTILPAILVAAACGTSTKHTVLNPSPRPMTPRPVATVELFSSGAPATPHVDVALIEVEESSSWSQADTPDMLKALRARGAALGCDAVVVGGAASRDTGINDWNVTPELEKRARRGFWGTCIVYRPGAPGELARQ